MPLIQLATTLKMNFECTFIPSSSSSFDSCLFFLQKFGGPEFKAIEGPEWVKNPLRQNCPKVKKTVNSNLKLIFSTLIFLNQTFPVVELKPELQSCPDSTLTSILS